MQFATGPVYNPWERFQARAVSLHCRLELNMSRRELAKSPKIQSWLNQDRRHQKGKRFQELRKQETVKLKLNSGL